LSKGENFFIRCKTLEEVVQLKNLYIKHFPGIMTRVTKEEERELTSYETRNLEIVCNIVRREIPYIPEGMENLNG
jgi:hypothetical protein